MKAETKDNDKQHVGDDQGFPGVVPDLGAEAEDNNRQGVGGDQVFPRLVPFPVAGAGDAEDAEVTLGDPQVVERYGDPVVCMTGNAGNAHVSGINEAFWAGLYSSENIVIYEPDERQFFQYDGSTGLYSVISADAIKQAISARLLEASREVPGWDRLERFRTDNRLNAIVSQLRGIVEKREFFSRFSSCPIKPVHFFNKFLMFLGKSRFETGFVADFRSRNRSPIRYDPDAKCPRFLKELLQPVLSSDDIILVQKMAGQFLLGKNPIQRLLIVDGPAGRGKTQLANLLQEIVGRRNVAQLRTRHLDSRFELQRFLGRSLLVGVGVDADFLSTPGASVIKGLIGDDGLEAEKKNSNATFQMQGNFNILMTANSRLRVRLQHDVGAWCRRLLIVRCAGVKPKRNIPHFAEMLIREEGAGIVNWALDGLTMLLEDIEQTGDIRLTSAQEGIVDDLLAESDSVQEFLQNKVEKGRGVGLSVSQLFQGYSVYCADQGWEPLLSSKIYGALRDLMRELFQVEQSHDFRGGGGVARGYHGVVFKQ